MLRLHGSEWEAPLKRNVTVLAFGKAVLGMVAAAHDILREHIVSGLAIVPVGLPASMGPHTLPPAVTVVEGAPNNMPDAASMAAAQRILDMASAAGKDDLVLVLASGGGSALLSLPSPGISLSDKQSVTRLLSLAGATIQELNTVRRHISAVKASRPHPGRDRSGISDSPDSRSYNTLILPGWSLGHRNCTSHDA